MPHGRLAACTALPKSIYLAGVFILGIFIKRTTSRDVIIGGLLGVCVNLFFASGSADVTGRGSDILARIAPTLQNAENQAIRIIGHADSIPIGKKLSATYPSNWELSTARATAIIQILQWGYGIRPERLVAEGVAHYRPLVMETNENRASNRVVEIILTAMTDRE